MGTARVWAPHQVDGALRRAGLGLTKVAEHSGTRHLNLCFSSVGASLGGLSLLLVQAWPKNKHLNTAGQAYPSAELCSDLHTNKVLKKKGEKERG